MLRGAGPRAGACSVGRTTAHLSGGDQRGQVPVNKSRSRTVARGAIAAL